MGTRLYTFAISHYAEKARWALDHKHLHYRETRLLPGLHALTTKRLAPRSSVPLLVDGQTTVQGSAPILDHVDTHYPEHPLLPDDPEQAEACRALEVRIDGELARALRRLFYLHALPDRRFALSLLVGGAPVWIRAPYYLAYGWLAGAIRSSYRVRPDREADDIAAVTAFFDALGSGPYLIGDRFSRADLALAAICAPLFRPPEHPIAFSELDAYPDGLRALMDRFASHPVAARVRALYRDHRRASA